MVKKIKKNACRCRGCGFLLVSEHRHDFNTHECVSNDRTYKFSVDGGTDYLRRIGDWMDFEEASEFTTGETWL